MSIEERQQLEQYQQLLRQRQLEQRSLDIDVRAIQTTLRRSPVSPQLEREVHAQGVAQAVVFLEPPVSLAGTALTLGVESAVRELVADLASLESCFVKDERSISGALASAGVSLATSAAPATRRSRGVRPPRRRFQDIPAMRRYDALGIVLGDVHPSGIDALARHPLVRYVASGLAFSLIRPVRRAAATLPAQATTWGIDRLGIPTLWAAGITGAGVKVGHLDTGVDGSHPTLAKAVEGFLMTDLDGFPVEPSVNPFDTETHGTHTAGTIAGRPVGGRRIGVAPGAGLYSAAVIEGGDVVARILAGLNWAATSGVKIVSMSLGLRGYHDDFLELMGTLRRIGILPVVASGNEGPGTSRSPGNYAMVLSVGASDEADAIPGFSSSQTFDRPPDPLIPDLVAPGVDVVSARAGGGYESMDGSSMATPHIAGLAALLWQAKPHASVGEIEAAILRSCVRGKMPVDRANRGLPHGPRAFELLTGNSLTVPSPGSKPRMKPLAPQRSRATRPKTKKKAAKRSAHKARRR